MKPFFTNMGTPHFNIRHHYLVYTYDIPWMDEIQKSHNRSETLVSADSPANPNQQAMVSKFSHGFIGGAISGLRCSIHSISAPRNPHLESLTWPGLKKKLYLSWVLPKFCFGHYTTGIGPQGVFRPFHLPGQAIWGLCDFGPTAIIDFYHLLIAPWICEFPRVFGEEKAARAPAQRGVLLEVPSLT